MTGMTGVLPMRCRTNGNIAIDRRTGETCVTLTNTGTTEAAFTVRPADPAVATSVLVGPLRCRRYRSRPAGGAYDLTVHGPEGFLRAFAGIVVPLDEPDTPAPAVHAELAGPVLRLEVRNEGRHGVWFTVTDNRDGAAETRYLPGGGGEHVNRRTRDGRYDVTVTTVSDPRFRYRFAG